MTVLQKPNQFQANVLVVPLFADAESEAVFQQAFLSAREALAQGSLRIRETGSVRSLIVEITDDVVVLLPEHEILEGGGQNRTPAGTFLLRRGTHEVPVFCVERGRWNPSGEQTFQHMAFQLPLEVRRAKLKSRLPHRPPDSSSLSYEQLRERLIRFLRSQEFRKAEEVADLILERSMDYLRNQGIQDRRSLPLYLPEIPDAWLHDVAVVHGVDVELRARETDWNIEKRREMARRVLGFLRDLFERREPTASRRDAQREVWEAVGRLLSERKIKSRSENVGEFYSYGRKHVEKVIRLFPLLPNQCGVMVFRNGHLRGIEWVASPQVWRSYHEPLLVSYFTDPWTSQDLGPEPLAWPSVSRIFSALQKYLSKVDSASKAGPSNPHCFPFSVSGLFSGAGEALFYEGRPYAVSVLAME